jgi:hypothetical protein
VVISDNAPEGVQVIYVSGAGGQAQTITFGALPAQPASAAFSISATSSANLPVTLASATPSVCTLSGSTVTPVVAGSCTINATQAGNPVYAAAAASASITLGSSQTISFGSIADQTFATMSLPLSATASSGLPVTFISITLPVCTVSGATVTFVAFGVCTIQAMQAGNNMYAPATAVTRSFHVILPPQTISFGALPSPTFGAAPFTISATASSGLLPVTLASTTAAVCTLSGTTVTIVAAGTCTIQATQAGNSAYAPAANSASITIQQALVPVNLTITPVYGSSLNGLGPAPAACQGNPLCQMYTYPVSAAVTVTTMTVNGQTALSPTSGCVGLNVPCLNLNLGGTTSARIPLGASSTPGTYTGVVGQCCPFTKANPPMQILSGPGPLAITLTALSLNPNFALSSTVPVVTVVPRNLSITYSGLTDFTTSPSAPTENLTFSYTVQDPNEPLFTDPALGYSPKPGNVLTAVLTLTLTGTSPTGPFTGSCTATTAHLATYSGTAVCVIPNVPVNGTYTLTPSAGPGSYYNPDEGQTGGITITNGNNGAGVVTGNGYQTATYLAASDPDAGKYQAAGLLTPAPGTQVGIGFDAGYTQTGLQSNTRITIHSPCVTGIAGYTGMPGADGLCVYAIQAGTVENLSFYPAPPPADVTFTSLANIEDITGSTPVTVAANLQLQMEMDFNGPPNNTTLAIQAMDDTNGLWFSNNWDGMQTQISATAPVVQGTFTSNPTGSVPNDFAGNGLSGALLYIPSSGQSYTALSNGNGTYSYVPNLLTPNFDTLRTGDYNGDGKTDLILYNSQTALAYIGFGNGDGTFDFQSLFWSPGYNIVETGDINGDGKTDVVLYNSTTGTLYTGISNGDGTFAYLYHLVSQGFTFVRLADFTGDGLADLLLYNSNSGVAFLGVGDGAGNFTFHALNISPGYALADTGDLNGDGKADVILYDPSNGNAATGISDGMGGFSFTPLIFSPGFTSVRLGNYTGHATADVTVYNKNTAAAYFGTGTGTGTFNFQSLFWSPGYDWVVPEDVSGNGDTDIVLYNSTTGTEYTGISNGNGTFNYTYTYWGPGRTLAR